MKKSPFLVKVYAVLADFFLFGGLCLLGYGLYIFRPWVSFAACGILLMAIGLFMGRGE